jgi:hypothetical protein
MKRHIVKADSKWQVVSTEYHGGVQLLVLPKEVHVSTARTIAVDLGMKVKHSTYTVCDYFGGTSKTQGYSPWDKRWVLG